MEREAQSHEITAAKMSGNKSSKLQAADSPKERAYHLVTRRAPFCV